MQNKVEPRDTYVWFRWEVIRDRKIASSFDDLELILFDDLLLLLLLPLLMPERPSRKKNTPGKTI